MPGVLRGPGVILEPPFQYRNLARGVTNHGPPRCCVSPPGFEPCSLNPPYSHQRPVSPALGVQWIDRENGLLSYEGLNRTEAFVSIAEQLCNSGPKGSPQVTC